MKVTGERFIPGRMFKHAEVEHMHRYSILPDLLENKIVLDAACGTGYGSSIIASHAAKVYGIDISQEAIDYAREHYGKCDNLEYMTGSVANLPFSDNMFDAVISFETVEHVDANTQIQFLKEIRRVLKPDGILIMSTPNKEIYTVQAGNQTTEWHVKEFYEKEFELFLKKEFSSIKYFQQYISQASYLLDGKKTHAQLENTQSEKKGKFIIAIAGNKKIDDKWDLNSIYYYPDEYTELTDKCQIYYADTFESFCEGKSDIVEIAGKRTTVNLLLETDEKTKIGHLRIDPSQKACAIENFKLEIIDSDNKTVTLKNIYDNADVSQENIKWFYHRDPQYIIDLDSAVYIKKVNISYTLLNYDLDAYPYLQEQLKDYKKYINDKEKKYLSELSQIQQERAEIAQERLEAIEERKQIAQERLEAIEERKQIAQERIEMAQERRHMIQEHMEMTEERKRIAMERERYHTRTVFQRFRSLFVNRD